MTEHGPEFTGAMAKGLIYGSPNVVGYTVTIYFLYPAAGLVVGTLAAVGISIFISITLFLFKSMLR